MTREDDAYRQKLAAQTVRWRLVLGVGSWGIALASAAFVGLALADASFVHVEGKTRLVAYAVPTIGSFLAAGYVLLRVGEIDLTTGRLVRATPVPWPRIAALVTLMAALAALVIAWPLGVYTSIRASRSECGERVPIEGLGARTSEPLSYATVSLDEDGCEVGIAAAGHATLAVVIRDRPAPDDQEWRSLVNRFHPDTREPLDLGQELSLLTNDDVFVIALRAEGRGVFVQLRRDVFDREDAVAIAHEMF